MSRVSKIGSSFVGHRMVGSERPRIWRTECTDGKFVQTVGADGLTTTPVPCGKCKHCRWVRRQAMANAVEMELRDADWAIWLTLTIAPGPQRAVDLYDKVLDKRLMQNFQKVCLIHKQRKTHGFLGRDCTSWRYIQCGEYGDLRGRAHYHAVIFGKGEKPRWADRDADRILIPEWPWGHVNVKSHVDGGVAFYLSKYMQKGGAKQSWSSASNRRAIGATCAALIGAARAKMGAAVPTLDWKVTMDRRKALLRGARRRELMLGFCQAKGVSVLSLAKLLPRVMLPSLVRIERERREREAGKGLGFFARERVKLEVWRDVRAVLGIVETDDLRKGKPIKPDGWRPVFKLRSAGDAEEQGSVSAARASWDKSRAAREARSAGLQFV